MICFMRHVPERDALDAAVKVLEMCERNLNDPHYGVGQKNPNYRANTEKSCAETRGYIEQRWGY